MLCLLGSLPLLLLYCLFVLAVGSADTTGFSSSFQTKYGHAANVLKSDHPGIGRIIKKLFLDFCVP